MATEYRYKLERGSVKHICPECGRKTFVRYRDAESQELIPEEYGRCDREIKCGFHKNPYTDSFGAGFTIPTAPSRPAIRKTKHVATSEMTSIPINVLSSTLSGYNQNGFIKNLLSSVPYPFDIGDIEQVIKMYYLGTVQSGYMKGAITLPFIDISGRVMAIQAKQFDGQNHSFRTSFLHALIEQQAQREGKPLPDWLEKYKANEKKVTCLFGAHLLAKYPGNPVALVEAPKSAIYGALYFGVPRKSTDLVWLAVYNLSSLTLDKCEVLKGRKVILFPDLSSDGKAYRLWQQKASELKKSIPGVRFVVSDLLEKNANDADREKGLDLADYLIKVDWRRFRDHGIRQKQDIEVQNPLPAIEDLDHTAKKHEHVIPVEGEDIDIVDGFLPEFIGEIKKEWIAWPVDSLIEFFDTAVLPQVVWLDACTEIVDVKKFINGHLGIIMANNGNPTLQPYFDRLEKLKHALGDESKH